jgi:Beta propeller domain
MLRQVRNEAELEEVLKRSLQNTVADGVPAGPVSLPNATAGNFSGTYLLENGVDELDFVRYDGTYLYIAPTSVWSTVAGAIRILRTDPASATATEVASIPLDADQESPRMVMGMYVADGRLFLMTTDAYFGPYGDVWTLCYVWAPTQFRVEVYDVHDPGHVRKLSSAIIDGVYVESRRMGDRVIVVSRHTPRAMLDPAKRVLLAHLPLAELLPAITKNGRSEPLIEPQSCYLESDSSGDEHSGYPVLTSITTFSMSDPDSVHSICYDQAADGVYASQDALYISEPRFDSTSPMRTRIHKFSLGGTHAEYSGSAEVPGALWGMGQPDFRMSESDGVLRVMTTESTGDPADALDHHLFVLRQKPAEHALEIIGRLPSEARPEKIGKPNESLFAVRFAANRAYAVTFRQVDPLYVLDLSKPTDPRIAGELEIPGFSQFLHPVSDGLLLGLGSDTGHFKLELFDTSVLEHPQSRGAITLGGSGSGSSVLYDRHAFTYLAGTDADRFAVPAYVVTELPGPTTSYVTGLHQFEILDKRIPSSALLQEAGVVAPPLSQEPALNRALIDADAVYYVRDAQVWGTFWSTPSQVNGPF